MAFGCGSLISGLIGAGLLQLWYLLDHVDGQLARFHRTQSLDGAQLDYLMHHFVNLTVPFGLGWGFAHGAAQPAWILVGLWLGVGLLFIGLLHDTRYKTFIQRLKRLEGRLLVIGGGAARPEPTPPIPRRPLRLLAWSLRKSCEIHVVINTLLALAVGQWLLGASQQTCGKLYLAILALLATLLASVALARGVRRGQSEREFAAWYQPCDGQTLVFENGWWRVVEIEGDRIADCASQDNSTQVPIASE